MEKLKNRNISLADLKKEIDSFIVMLGDDIDFETKFNIELCKAYYYSILIYLI